VTTRTRRNESLDSIREWARVAARAADEKKGLDTVVLQVGEVLVITDFFVISSAPNSRQVRTIAEAVEATVKAAGGPSPLRIEGQKDLTWVFNDETRRFYDLERLWRDVPRVPWRERLAAEV
jgi:ribosome-associated protein